MKIVVVESPAKAKTINAYLGRGYEVLASFGHVRDLPPKDGSVDPDHDFKMIWEIDPKSQQRLNSIGKEPASHLGPGQIGHDDSPSGRRRASHPFSGRQLSPD